MSHLITTSFSRFSLTQEEAVSGQTLTTQNIQFMQNLMCDAAEEKLALKFDPFNPMEFAQREAELMGQIGILRMLIEFSRQPSTT
jgi:hypothetical protein